MNDAKRKVSQMKSYQIPARTDTMNSETQNVRSNQLTEITINCVCVCVQRPQALSQILTLYLKISPAQNFDGC